MRFRKLRIAWSNTCLPGKWGKPADGNDKRYWPLRSTVAWLNSHSWNFDLLACSYLLRRRCLWQRLVLLLHLPNHVPRCCCSDGIPSPKLRSCCRSSSYSRRHASARHRESLCAKANRDGQCGTADSGLRAVPRSQQKLSWAARRSRPHYLSSIPAAKNCLKYNEFTYYTPPLSNATDRSMSLLIWWDYPPFGRHVYSFDTGQWRYVD